MHFYKINVSFTLEESNLNFIDTLAALIYQHQHTHKKKRE